MKLQEAIQANNEVFLEICQEHNVSTLYVFGSALTKDYSETTSDIDLLVSIDEEDPLERGEKLMSLWDKLEAFFQRKIDLVTESSIKNPVFRKSINATKTLIYDGRGQKILI